MRIVLWILLLAAGAEFVVRGPVRNLRPTNWNDLAQNYAASRIWLRGQNFSDPENFVRLWRDEANSTLGAGTLRTHLAPMPGTLVLLAPIAALPWPLAKAAWLALLMTAFFVIVWALIRIAPFQLTEPRTLGFVAGCLALAPFHTGIAVANQSILVVGLCALGIWAARVKNDLVAGLLFGAACSFKPHIGSFLVLYYLLQRRWRLFATALGITAAITLVAILRMEISGVSWVRDYFQNLSIQAAHNRIDDFTSANPIRFLLINLQVPFYSITRSARASNYLALSLGCVLIGVWAYLITWGRAARSELQALAAIAVIGLLPVYHRLYDAAVLAIPLCWCLSELTGSLKSVSKAALFLMTPFLIPGPALLQQLAAQGRIPASWLQTWWWNEVVMPHETWFLLLLSLVLLFGLAQTREQQTAAKIEPRT